MERDPNISNLSQPQKMPGPGKGVVVKETDAENIVPDIALEGIGRRSAAEIAQETEHHLAKYGRGSRSIEDTVTDHRAEATSMLPTFVKRKSEPNSA